MVTALLFRSFVFFALFVVHLPDWIWGILSAQRGRPGNWAPAAGNRRLRVYGAHHRPTRSGISESMCPAHATAPMDAARISSLIK